MSFRTIRKGFILLFSGYLSIQIIHGFATDETICLFCMPILLSALYGQRMGKQSKSGVRATGSRWKEQWNHSGTGITGVARWQREKQTPIIYRYNCSLPCVNRTLTMQKEKGCEEQDWKSHPSQLWLLRLLQLQAFRPVLQILILNRDRLLPPGPGYFTCARQRYP